jgi:NAD(P)-dependent dehydrogenase (short-subunit alcohol dehydrogenase family)
LSGKAALVTGGSRGVGRAIVLGLARAGARVGYCYLKDAIAAGEMARVLRAETREEPFYMQADITRADDREALVDQSRQALGGLDILVNNAGTTNDRMAVRMGGEWQEVIDLDLNAPFFMSQLALKIMIRQSSGRIINIGSVASRIGLAGQANYTAAKAGLEGLTRSLAQEYGKRGITVNTVNPGFIHTELTSDASDSLMEFLANRTAIPKLPTPEAVASLVVFLASDPAWAITGQTINVDCGLVKL